MIQLSDDLVGAFGPDEGPGIVIVLGNVAVDRGLQLDDRAEHAAPEATPGQRGEEALDRVQPRARGGREVEGPAGMPLEPGQYLRVLVGAAVVEDAVHQLAGRDRRL